MWVENAHAGSVPEYKGTTLTKPGASIPVPALTNLSPDFRGPTGGDTAGVTFDSSNNQWVSNCIGSKGSTPGHGNITEFKLSTLKTLTPTKNMPQADVLLTDDGTGNLLSCPWAMAFNAGNLWAANSDQLTVPPGFVTQYQASQLTKSGDPTPHIKLTDPNEFVSPTGVVFDSSGNLFVSDFGPKQFDIHSSTPGRIWVFKASTVASLIAGTNIKTSDARLYDGTTQTPVNGTFDSSGNLWVADCYANGNLTTLGEIYMFPKSVLTKGASSATVVFQTTTILTPNGIENTLACPGGIAFDAQGNLWYTNFEETSTRSFGAVGEFTKSQLSVIGKSKPVPNIFLDGSSTTDNFDGPIGLAFGPAL